MEATKRANERTENAINDLGAAMREGEELLAGTAEAMEDNGHHLRAKLQEAIQKAKALYGQLEDKTVAAAKATDKVVHDHPYHAMGITFGVGVLIGILAMRARRD